jgi:hypothetical protein
MEFIIIFSYLNQALIAHSSDPIKGNVFQIFITELRV